MMLGLRYAQSHERQGDISLPQAVIPALAQCLLIPAKAQPTVLYLNEWTTPNSLRVSFIILIPAQLSGDMSNNLVIQQFVAEP